MAHTLGILPDDASVFLNELNDKADKLDDVLGCSSSSSLMHEQGWNNNALNEVRTIFR